MKVEERDPNRSRDRKGVLQIIDSSREPICASLSLLVARSGPLEHSLTVAALPEVALAAIGLDFVYTVP